jgi:Nuclear protein 96/Nucleoporin autopeptidase/Nucleoporin FG repeat region
LLYYTFFLVSPNFVKLKISVYCNILIEIIPRLATYHFFLLDKKNATKNSIMFGQSNNTPFGGGFGQASNTAPSAFGSAAPAPTGMGLFGAPAPAVPSSFGQPQQQHQQQQTSFGGGFGGGFGAAAPAPSQGLFGNPAPAPAATGGGFGFGSAAAPAPSTFGSTGLFGQQPAQQQQQQQPSAFGSAASTLGLGGGGLFGSAPAPATSFGSNAFGSATTTQNTFGAAPATSTFGAQPSLFGAAPAPAAPTMGLFGAPAPAPAATFGSPTPAPFGQTSTFGATAPAGGLFSSTATNPAPSVFGGAPAASQQPFGMPASGQGQGGVGGTRATPYQVTSRHDGTSAINVQSITAMPAYESKSFEELRFEDYSQGNRGSASTPTASGGAAGGGAFFGSPTGTNMGGGGGGFFGGAAPAPAPQATLFGAAPAPNTSLFGAPPAPAPATFGTGGSLFANPAPAPAFNSTGGGGGGLFGNPGPAPGPTTNLFGAPTAAAPTTTGFGFGGAGSTQTFGSPAPASFGQSSGGGLFAPAPAPSTSFGGGGGFGFGPSPAPAYGSTPGAGLFGQQQPAPTTTSFGFGAPQSSGTSLFGQQPAPASTFGFGGQPAPAPSSYFGAAPAALGGSLFGSNPQQAAPPGTTLFSGANTGGGGAHFSFQQNAAIIPPATNEMLAQQLRSLEKATEDFKKQEVWQSSSPIGKSASSTPTGVSEAESLMNYNNSRLSPLYSSPQSFMSPQSHAKIRPRGVGFPKTDPGKKSSGGAALNQPMISRMGRTPTSARSTLSLAPRDSYFPSPTLQLVVKPNALAKPIALTAVQFRLDMESPPPRASAGAAAESDSPQYGSEPVNYTPTDGTRRTDSQRDSSPSHHPNRASPVGRDQAAATAGNSSPANSYYQQTVGTTDNGYASGLQKSSSSVPKLTKAGYETFPPLDALAAMSDADLAAVPNFAVIRPNYGAVQWEGAVDVRGTNLDRVVVIEAKDVSVYNHEEREGTKPAVGTKLNRPATLTYYQVFPKDNPAASVAEKEKFAAKLEKSARRMDADFVSYDMENGDWKIRVHHFSRYALVVDEDDTSQASEEEEAVGAVSSHAAAVTSGAGKKSVVRFADVATPQRPSSSSFLKRKATPYKQPSNRTQFAVSESYTEDDDDEIMETDDVAHMGLSEADIMDEVRAKAQTAYDEIFSMVKQHESNKQPRFSATPAKPLVRTAIANEDDELYCDDESADYVDILPPKQKDILQARQVKSITGILAQQAGVGKAGVDLSLRMGRSFRVAASPNGFFVMPDARNGGFQKFVPKFNKDMSVVEKMDDLLNAHLLYSQKEYTQDSKCPLFRLPQAKDERASLESLYDTLVQFGSKDCGNKDAQAAFGLIACLLESTVGNAGQDDGARQNTAVLRWLVDVCAADVDRDIASALRRNDVPSAVFCAISGGDIEKACDVAADAGCIGLATVLATDVDGRSDIVRLLARLDETGDVSGVSPELLRSLNHVAGDSRFEVAPFRHGRSNLDWRRRLALRLLQEPKEDLYQIIRRYELDVKSGAAPFPSPPYSGSVAGGAGKGVESIHFRVMRAMTKPGSMELSEIVSPEGFSQSINDSSMAFHFSAALSAAGAAKSTEQSELLLVDLESQLVSQERWELAIFVSLCLTGDVSEVTKRRKLKRAKDLLLAHFWKGDPQADYCREFLETNLSIPSTWFSEAMAGRAVALSDYICNELDVNPDNARATVECRSLPYLFFRSPAEIEDFMKFIEDHSSAAGNADSLTGAVYDFFRLKDRVHQLMEDKNQDEIDQVLPELEAIRQKVESIIRSRQRQVEALRAGGDGGETRCFVGFPKQRMDMSNMLSEALHHLRQLRLLMASLRSTQIEPALLQDGSDLIKMMDE